MAERVFPFDGQAQTHTVSATRPSAAGDGVDTSGFFIGWSRVSITLDADAARTLTSPTGGTAGVEVWGRAAGQWSIVGRLNSGTDIPLPGDTQGWIGTIDLGRSFDRLAVAGTPSGGTITAKFAPVLVD
jgi:hypothetical protein